jgi:hypothetical protein
MAITRSYLKKRLCNLNQKWADTNDDDLDSDLDSDLEVAELVDQVGNI